jgi:hypothetical protein
MAVLLTPTRFKHSTQKKCRQFSILGRRRVSRQFAHVFTSGAFWPCKAACVAMTRSNDSNPFSLGTLLRWLCGYQSSRTGCTKDGSPALFLTSWADKCWGTAEFLVLPVSSFSLAARARISSASRSRDRVMLINFPKLFQRCGRNFQPQIYCNCVSVCACKVEPPFF